MDSERFFILDGDKLVRVYTERGQWVEVGTLEYLYQQFKARMMAELAVSAPDLSTMGVLINRPEGGK
jgi:hypothetical protein